LRVGGVNIPEKILWLVRIKHILAYTQAGAYAVLYLKHKVFQLIAEPGSIAYAVGVFTTGVPSH
jgi:hypothetical protein